jgi:hypothetical protein
MEKCEICDDEFIPNWDGFICDSCMTIEWDRQQEEKLGVYSEGYSTMYPKENYANQTSNDNQ